MGNTITIELCAEDRARLDRIAELLEPVRTMSPSLAVNEEGKAFGKGFVVGVDLASEQDATLEHAIKPVEPEKPVYTMSDIQSLVQTLAAPGSGKRNEVREIVKDYAERVSLIPEEKYAEVMARLTALKEG